MAVAPAWIVQGIGSLWWLIRGPHRIDAIAHAMLTLCAVGCSVFGAVSVHLRLQRHHYDQDINLLERWH